MTEELEYAKGIFDNPEVAIRACVFCAGIHDRVKGLAEFDQPCPRIKRILRSEGGHILELEFWPNGQWEAGIVFSGSVYDNEDPEDGVPA